jgi:hypothetical protein
MLLQLWLVAHKGEPLGLPKEPLLEMVDEKERMIFSNKGLKEGHTHWNTSLITIASGLRIIVPYPIFVS